MSEEKKPDPPKKLGEFDAHYLGSVSVKASEGSDVCADALLRIRSLEQDEKKVKLLILTDNVVVRDTKTKEDIKSAMVQHVSFVTMDPSDKKIFSYITHEPQMNLMMCHAFRVQKNVEKIPIALNEAFMLSAGKVKKLRRRSSSKAALTQATSEKRIRRKESLSVSLGTFNASYLGSVAVNKPRGNEVALDALKRIQSLRQVPRAVDVIISSRNVDVVISKSIDVLKSIPIMEISFTAIHPKDSKLMLWITSDERLDLMYCHAFQCKKTKAEKVLAVMVQAFEEAKKRIEATNGDVDALKELGVMPMKKAQSGAIGTFEAKYIGSVPAIDIKGVEVAEKCIIDAKHLNAHPEGVIVMVNSEGVRVIAGLTGESVLSVLISSISFVTSSGSKKEILAFISQDPRLKRISCHVFECRRSADITRAIGAAFKRAREEAEKRAGNPFTPLSEEREAVSGPLFKLQVHRSDIVPGKPIGAGQFGQVYLATFKSSKVAVKTVRDTASVQDKDEFVEEAETMMHLNHPNLVNILGVSLQQRPWLCVIEYMEYGDLRDVLIAAGEKGVSLQVHEQIHIAKQLSAGMAFMASKRYIHMDIAARNCLISFKNQAKIADFGLTRRLEKGQDTYKLTKAAKLPVRWMAPETLRLKLFSEASDVWAFGILLWEIMTYGELPYKDTMNKDIQKAIVTGVRVRDPEGDTDFYALAQACFETDTDERINFAQLTKALESLFEKKKTGLPQLRDVGLLVKSG